MTPDIKRRFAWLPIPLFLAAILVLWAMDLRTVYESRTVLTVCIFLFWTTTSALVAILVAWSYLVRGSPGLLLLGCGVLIWGAAGTLAPVLFPYGTNAMIGGHNAMVWLSALCHLAGALLFLKSWRAPRFAGLTLALAYAVALSTVWLVALLATAGLLPVFFVQGQGGTPLRTFVLGSAIAMFAFTAAVLRRANRLSPSVFARWYGAALLLVATGLLGVSLQTVHGCALGWTGRAAQFLGGAYMLVAAIAAVRTAPGRGIWLTAALRASEDRYRNLVELSPDAIIVHQDGRIVFANPAALRLHGASSAAELLGRPVLDLVHPDDREPVRARMASSLGGARTPAREFRALRLDGQAIAVETTGVPVEFDGRPAVQVILRDVTERKQAAESLKASEDRLRVATESARIGFWSVDIPSRSWAFSPRAATLFGLSDGRPATIEAATRQTHPDDRERLAAESARALAEAGEHDLEYRVVHPDGQVRWILLRGHTDLDAEGRPWRNMGIVMDITERRRAEQREQEALALAAASQAAVDVLDAMGEGVLLLDMIGRIMSVNPALERLSGIPAGEVIGRPVRDVLPEVLSPGEHALVEEALRAALEGRKPELGALTLLSRTGHRIPVIPSVTFVRGTGGQPTAIVATLRDISELRAAQESLEESNALLGRIFDNTHLSIAYLDRDLNFVRVNRTYADSCGHEPGFFRGKNHFDLYPHAENEALFRRVVETGETLTISEKPFDFPDHPEWGVTYWDWTLRPLRGDKNHVESLLLCLLNVTPRVKARQGLVESERKYRELVESANSIIMRITPDHNITFFNEYAQTFFGFAADEVLGRNVVGTIVPETDSEGRDLRVMVRDITAQPELHASNENENMRKDGRRVWVHWANRAVRDAQGNIVEILCVGTDITQRKRMEKEADLYRQRLRELADCLAATEEMERRRISTQIHDTVIQTLSLSRIRLGGLRKAAEAAGLAEHCEKMDQVRGLLEDGIGECRNLMADLTPPLLYELGLGPALKDFARKQQMTHGIGIAIEEDDHPKPLDEARRGFLFQAARELVMNALKHARPERIRISLSREDDGVCLQVHDKGCGFDPASLDGHVKDFEKGGFGLFNIRERLQGLGGQLDIVSAPGQGTTVTIRMPMQE